MFGLCRRFNQDFRFDVKKTKMLRNIEIERQDIKKAGVLLTFGRLVYKVRFCLQCSMHLDRKIGSQCLAEQPNAHVSRQMKQQCRTAIDFYCRMQVHGSRRINRSVNLLLYLSLPSPQTRTQGTYALNSPEWEWKLTLFLPQQHNLPTHQLLEVYLCIAASHSKSEADPHKFCLCHRPDIRTRFARNEPPATNRLKLLIQAYIHKLCLLPHYEFTTDYLRTRSFANSTNGKKA